MTEADYGRKLDELERLLNDPNVPMEPDRIWTLLADVSRPEGVAYGDLLNGAGAG